MTGTSLKGGGGVIGAQKKKNLNSITYPELGF